MEENIVTLLDSRNLDIRQTKYRFMDQKVTPDVLAFIADCIVNLPSSKGVEFTKNDVWQSEYFAKNVSIIYSKPASDNETVQHEYDKFTAQPLKTLAYAGVLEETKKNNMNYYTVNNREILEHIALRDINAFNFLYLYLSRVLDQSGFKKRIDEYISMCRKNYEVSNAYDELKTSFEKFILGNTKINTIVEARRIFPKVINILAVANNIPGSRKGVITDGQFLYSDLMYNGTNFRDIGKQKYTSRQEAVALNKKVAEYSNYEMKKTMDAIRKRHFPTSEVNDSFANGSATQVHHIFSQKSHPHLKSTLENLILITPQQHNVLAHTNNNTRVVNIPYQYVCLLSKCNSIEQSAALSDGFYSKQSFINILRSELKIDISDDSSFDHLRQMLHSHQVA